MKTAIILHGRPTRAEYFSPSGPSPSNRHWLPWLQHQLILKGYLTQTPELPHPYAPTWEDHRREFERYQLSPETLLVGHSFGGGFLVRWLSEHKEVRVSRLALVAPYIDVEKEDPHGFFEFEIDQNLARRCGRLSLIHSSNDAPEIQSSVRRLRRQLAGARYLELANRGHFTTGATAITDTFPELLDELTGD